MCNGKGRERQTDRHETLTAVFRSLKAAVKNPENGLLRTDFDFLSPIVSIEREIRYNVEPFRNEGISTFNPGLNQIGHFNTENVTKLTKTKTVITPTEEPEVGMGDRWIGFQSKKLILQKERKMDVDEDGEIPDLYVLEVRRSGWWRENCF